jgi:hypothetical protein
MMGKCFLANCGMVEISYPLCSHNLMSVACFLFPKVKTALKGRRFQDIKDIQKNITTELNAVLLDALYDSFVQLLERHKKYVVSLY